jgi:hypothetical protein
MDWSRSSVAVTSTSPPHDPLLEAAWIKKKNGGVGYATVPNGFA